MGCGLRKEIEGMMSLMPEKHRLRMNRPLGGGVRYEVELDVSWPHLAEAYGDGATKKDALEDLLARWRSSPSCPARSREELMLKLAARGGKP